MARLSKDERAELEARLKADDDEPDEPDHEFDYTEGERSIRLPWSKRHELSDFGFKGAPKRAEPKEPKAPAAKDDEAPANVKRFGRTVS